MNATSTARRALVLAALAAAGIVALTGCKIGGGKDAANSAPSTAASPSTSASASGKAGGVGSTKASPKASGSASKKSGTNALVDPCTLLSKAEVSALAGGKSVVQVDPDGADETDTTRFCQWQLSGARLAIFLSPTTASEFSQAKGDSRAVDGVGDAAFMASGHLYVRSGNLQIDVYASNGNDAASEKMAKSTALKVLPRL